MDDVVAKMPFDGDKLFQDSPDAGHPACVCSRCGQLIEEHEMPLRAFVDEGRGGEYRYHMRCVGLRESDEPDEWLPEHDDAL